MSAEDAGDNAAASKPIPGRRGPSLGFALLLLFWALAFKATVTIVLAAGLTWLSFEILFRRNKTLIVCVLSTLLSYGVFELVGGIVLTRRQAAHFNPNVDHRLIPGVFPGVNQDGLRCDFEAGDFAADTFNIIFLGDSFTYGQRLADGAAAFPGVVEEFIGARQPQAPVRSINFGWPSSSPLLSYRLLRDIGAKYQPDLVILSVDMTDFHEDVDYRRALHLPRVSPTDYLLWRLGQRWVLIELERMTRVPELWRRWFSRRVPSSFIVTQPLEDSRPLLRDIEGSIRDIAHHCREELGCGFLLVLLPRNFQYNERESPRYCEPLSYDGLSPFIDEPFRWLIEFAQTVDFPCYSLREDFRETTVFPTCYEDDPHWNAAGHRVAAEAIVRILEQEGYVPRQP